MIRVSIEDLEVAKEWLSINDGDAGEMESCQRVSAWIGAEIQERNTRSIAREAGVTAAVARRKIKSLTGA